MIKTLVYTYEERDLLKKEFLNKLDSIWDDVVKSPSVVILKNNNSTV